MVNLEHFSMDEMQSDRCRFMKRNSEGGGHAVALFICGASFEEEGKRCGVGRKVVLQSPGSEAFCVPGFAG